jgi:hypothetical protein
MTFEERRWAFRQALIQRVGGFFRNVRYIPGENCIVCSVPPEPGSELCNQCRFQKDVFGSRLADQAVILSYAKGWTPGGTPHQSVHTLRAYKRIPPADKCAKDLALMMLAATYIHGQCIARVAGSPWSTVTFVSSVERPGSEHPAAELARHVAGPTALENRLLLELGPGMSDPDRIVRADRFIVPERYIDRVEGRHVLIVDDTWTTGAKIQSAAVTLHDAGASTVTALCAGRWCDYRRPDHRQLLDSCTDPYDATICPVTGSYCPQ